MFQRSFNLLVYTNLQPLYTHRTRVIYYALTYIDIFNMSTLDSHRCSRADCQAGVVTTKTHTRSKSRALSVETTTTDAALNLAVKMRLGMDFPKCRWDPECCRPPSVSMVAHNRYTANTHKCTHTWACYVAEHKNIVSIYIHLCTCRVDCATTE